jgi:lysophospholipase L1-like esterase
MRIVSSANNIDDCKLYARLEKGKNAKNAQIDNNSKGEKTMIHISKFKCFVALCFTLMMLPVSAAEDQAHWIGTWAASPFGFQAFGPEQPPAPFTNQTVRQKLRISVGGEQVRIRFSNELGMAPLKIGAATVALAGDGAAIDSASLHTVTFGGETSIIIPPGAPALSDPVDLAVADLAELAVSIYLPEEAAPASLHMGRTAYIGSSGDQTTAATIADAELSTNHVFLTGIYVLTDEAVNVIAALGDSITDGAASTPHSYHSWPDYLAARIAGSDMAGELAIVNHGISGNQVLRDGAGVSALARFDRDVLSTPGLTHIILLEGINDIGTGGFQFPGASGPAPANRSAGEIIAGYRQLIARAHSQGIRIFGATLTPFEGTFAGYYTPEKDAVRIEVNEWIRSSDEFDGVIDFEAAIRDADNPRIMRAEYNSGDSLHPGDAGYERMAEFIDLKLFE